MNSKITKKDVFLYFANKLDRARRRELEAASRTDQQVRRWFAELTPTAEELRQQPLPQIQLDSPTFRNLAVITYQSIVRDEEVAQWAEELRNPATNDRPVSDPPAQLGLLELFQDLLGTLLYREQVAMEVGADPQTFSVPPPDVPRINPDYAAGRLVIRQTLDRVPGGVVEVIVARRRGEGEFTKLPPRQIQLEHTAPPQGEPYWYADVSLEALIGEYVPGDDFIYCVVPAPKA